MAEKRGRPEKVEVAGTEDLVQENDYLILYNGPDAMTAVKATSGASVQTGRGEFALGELAGFPYGRRFFASKGLTGFVYPLRASPELLTAGGLAHRTQLVHSSDVSYITFALELRAGHRVVEAGTGSGSLTNALARITGDSGHVFTFEFHEERANFAKEAFAAIGNSSRITVTHRDVCEQGFLLEQDGRLLPGGADAVFLDVPCPWLAIGHVMTVLRPGGSLACYSPCLEQVAKTCEAMRVAGMQDISTVEVRQHPWEAEIKSKSAWEFDLAGEKGQQQKKKASRVDLKSDDAMLLLKPRAGETPGHTAFLTFCKKKL